MNLEPNAIKSERRYNDKTTTTSLRALVRVLCHLVNADVGFLKMAVASTGSGVRPISIRLHHYSTSRAVTVPTLELELQNSSKRRSKNYIIHSSCSADAIKREVLLTNFLEL